MRSDAAPIRNNRLTIETAPLVKTPHVWGDCTVTDRTERGACERTALRAPNTSSIDPRQLYVPGAAARASHTTSGNCSSASSTASCSAPPANTTTLHTTSAPPLALPSQPPAPARSSRPAPSPPPPSLPRPHSLHPHLDRDAFTLSQTWSPPGETTPFRNQRGGTKPYTAPSAVNCLVYLQDLSDGANGAPPSRSMLPHPSRQGCPHPLAAGSFRVIPGSHLDFTPTPLQPGPAPGEIHPRMQAGDLLVLHCDVLYAAAPATCRRHALLPR